MSEPDELAKALFCPHTIGGLKKMIEHMDDNLPVFQLEIGNREGRYYWKRKLTWKKWLKENKSPSSNKRQKKEIAE